MAMLLKKIALYLCLLLSVLALFALPGKVLNRLYLDSLRAQLKPGAVTVIAGDSHTETALDPGLIPGSVNISRSGENYFYTYYKLKYLLDHSPNRVRNLVLSFSYQSLARDYQERFLFERARSAASFDAYYLLLDGAGKKLIEPSPNRLLFYCKYDLGLPLQLHRDYYRYKGLIVQRLTGKTDEKLAGMLGGYTDRFSSDPSRKNIEEKIRLYYFDDAGRQSGTSAIMAGYLDRILSLCRERGIAVRLFNAPLHPLTRQRVPAAALAGFRAVQEDVLRKYPGTTVLDYSGYPVPEGSWLDGDHLNAHGARKLSRELAGTLGS